MSRHPAVTAEQMREVDRVMEDDLGIGLVQMMEHAGRHLATLALDRYRPSLVVVLAGSGGNGGGGLAAARHLANRGIKTIMTLARPIPQMAEIPARQARTAVKVGVLPVAGPVRDADLVIDALIGYSLEGNPRGGTARLIRWANEQPAPVLSLDLPSGLDATTGRVGEPCIRADATMTLAMPKTGLYESPEVVGDLYLADITVPGSVYQAFGLDVGDPFTDGAVVRVG